MKYTLRSASAEQQTNELSAPLPEKTHFKKNSKMKYNTEASPKRKKLKKNQKPKTKSLQRKARSKKSQTIHEGPLHDSILRFPLKYQKKTLRVYCYKESDLQIKKRFSKCYGQNEKDDDLESWESLIEAQVERCKKDLFESIRKYSEAKQQAKEEEKNQTELSTDDSNNLSLTRANINLKKGKKIIKKAKNKKNK